MRKKSQYNVKVSPKKGEEGIVRRRRKADRCERGMTEGDRMNKGLHSPRSIFGYLSVWTIDPTPPPLPMVGMVEEMVVVVALGQWIKPCRLKKKMPHAFKPSLIN